MALLAHSRPLSLDPRPALRLLERPARTRLRPGARASVPDDASDHAPLAWLDHPLERLADWAEAHWPQRRTNRVARV